MKRFLIFILLVGAVGLGLGYTRALYRAQHPLTSPAVGTPSDTFANAIADDFFPKPLQRLAGKSVASATTLNAREVINLTNNARLENGQKALKENSQLTLAAHRKISDMIQLQYFEHKSPTGKEPADIIEAAGYAYVVVGENLAEGDFADSADLVQGWMNSPGHRANILNEKFTEIGVAVERGELNGKQVWFAVQEFGRPLTDCPHIDQTLKTQIRNNETQIQSLQLALQQAQAEMSQAKQNNHIDTYNSLVPKYNTLADQINALVAKTKHIVSTYNNQVQLFNACVE